MPNRIIRDAILTSEAVASLGWSEEVFYRRLHSVVDDYGRYEANPQLLRSRCYPLQTDSVRTADITRWMAACQKAGLILCYEVASKQYLEVLKFGQQQRSASKYPPPPAVDSACNHLLADAHLVVSEVVSEVVSTPPVGVGLFDEFWKAYPNKTGKDAARRAFDKRKPGKSLVEAMLTAIAVQRVSKKWTDQGGQFIPHPSTWLDEGRWKDEAVELAAPGGISTVPSKPGRDPELVKREHDEKRRAAPSLETLAAIAKIKAGATA